MNYSFTLILDSNFKFKNLIKKCEEYLDIDLRKIGNKNVTGIQEDLGLFLYVSPRQMEFRLTENLKTETLDKLVMLTKRMLYSIFNSKTLGVIYHNKKVDNLFGEPFGVNIINL
ncbi:hypothetical protein [Bacillus sp. JS]|uniref:hypothetical protein n=1 Tax=Bacillus sp. JS TaxID=1127744 RepID=UPI000259773B|nr:hypothetical protein [Bacillus sp. JS]AFI27053.1 hypothetical protein MY9_0514 [Bacillus sp. JS]MCY8187664.1 hypothetical protein [Bacillus spizizenii]MCY9242982.1 hypothetical protein [Bacillus spizizenii]